jgi:hypothetical protein
VLPQRRTMTGSVQARSRTDQGRHSEPVTFADDVRMIALYQSSYYPDGALSGDSDTSSWLTVASARPIVPGQRQPHVPGDLGFYDLRLAETRHEQARLARSYGVHGFCYDESWGQPDFHTLPFREMIESASQTSRSRFGCRWVRSRRSGDRRSRSSPPIGSR